MAGTLPAMSLCTACGVDNPAEARFCMGCGSRLTAPAPTTEERRVVSVLFCDIVGFTGWSETVDPEDVRAVLDAFHQLARVELERFGGTVEKFIGDAVMAVYGVPLAHEDDPERAVQAALAVLAALPSLDGGAQSLELTARIGIGTGEVLASLDARPQRGESFIAGDVVNTAARLQAIASPGTVVVDRLTYRLARGRVDFVAGRPVTVKGKARPIPIWRVTGVRPSAGERRAVPMVARDADLDRLRRAFADVRRDGRASLVSVTGEPGVGKSRLVAELRAADPARWRQGRCLPYGEGAGVRALGEVVKAEAGILEDDDADAATAKLGAVLDQMDVAEDERVWLASALGPVIGLFEAGSTEGTGGASRVEVFAAWRRFVHAMVRDEPSVLVIEDLQWAGATLLEFVGELLDPPLDAPLLIVTTARPELSVQSPTWGDGQRATSLRLAPLSDRDSAVLVAALAGQAVLPVETQQLLIARSGGNPLFAEEYVRLLGSLSARSAAAAAHAVPDSLRSLIAARLDLLAPSTKAVLHDAAVLGTAVWPDALRALSPDRDEHDLRAGIDRLVDQELLRPVADSSVAGQPEYAFWHDLVREVAYAQIPRRNRAESHVRVARWFEGLAAGRVADHVDVIVHHYDQALELAAVTRSGQEELVAPARRYRALAADLALHRDPQAADRQFDRALELFPDDDPDRPPVLVRAAWAALSDGQPDRAIAMLTEASEAADRRIAAIARLRLASLLQDKVGDSVNGLRLCLEAQDLLRDQPLSRAHADAVLQRAWYDVMAGRFDDALELANELETIADRLGSRSARAAGAMLRGVAAVMLDDPAGLAHMAASVADYEAVLASGRQDEAGTLELLGASINYAELRWLVEGVDAGKATSESAGQLALSRGFVDRSHEIRADGLKVLFDAGDWDRLVAEADAANRWCTAHGGQYSALLAEIRGLCVHVHRGSTAPASRRIAAILDEARAIGDLQVLGPALELAALLAHARGLAGEAVDAVRELVTVAADVPPRRAEHLLPLLRVCLATDELALAHRLADGTDLRIPRHAASHLAARALLAEATDDRAAALELHTRAAATWRAYGAVLERGHALLGVGRCSEDAAAVAEAQQIFDRLGIPSGDTGVTRAVDG